MQLWSRRCSRRRSHFKKAPHTSSCFLRFCPERKYKVPITTRFERQRRSLKLYGNRDPALVAFVVSTIPSSHRWPTKMKTRPEDPPLGTNLRSYFPCARAPSYPIVPPPYSSPNHTVVRRPSATSAALTPSPSHRQQRQRIAHGHAHPGALPSLSTLGRFPRQLRRGRAPPPADSPRPARGGSGQRQRTSLPQRRGTGPALDRLAEAGHGACWWCRWWQSREVPRGGREGGESSRFWADARSGQRNRGCG